MAGYTRQSTADIIPTATLRAAPINAEYNALRDAFAASGGHKHDGTTAEGEYVPLIADLDAKNKVEINTGANTVDFYVEVSSVPVKQISVRDGSIRPITDNDIDLGGTGAEFKDLYINGIGYIDTLAVHENATVAGTLNVTGVITAPAGVVANITGNLTGNVTGNITGDITGDLTGDVTSTGTSTFATADIATANITSGDMDSGTIDNSVIGNATPAAGTFTTLAANTSLTAATADINGGTLDGVIIGAGTAAAATVTDFTATGTSTLSTVDINAGAIDGTTIGASVPSTGAFTTITTTGQATLATADINGGSIDGSTIGVAVPSSGAFTTVAASGGVTANVTGNLTGNVTGNLSGGNVTGNVTGDLTGNVTAASGSSSFNNVTIDGTLNMNAGTTATIQNLTAPTNDLDAATKKYVDDEVAGVLDAAPAALDTLNELAAALGDDANFSATVTASIATKLPLAGGTMSGEIAMGSSKITGVTDPTGAQDASTKAYTDAQRDTRVAKGGDTMSGNLAMGANKVTGLAAPVDAGDAATKAYVDTTNASNTAAATSATNAATSETNAATSETNAATSETNAGNSATAAAASYDSFDDRYLGAKSAAPSVDNDGATLIIGALYFNSTTAIMYVYGSGGWQAAGSSVNGTSDRQTYTATAGQTVFAATYDPGYIDVYLNGVKLAAADFTASSGTSITLASGAAVNDVLDTIAYGTFVLADHYTGTQSDARYLGLAGGTMTGDIDGNGNKVLFGNVYSQLADLPSASTYHGMFAHVHATGKGYFAHAGAWVPLANETATLALSGGAMTGAITTNSTFDGRDVATDGTKLDGIETAATADQTKADIEGLGIDVPAANLTGTIAAARLSTAATQAESDDSTKIATTAYVTDKITTLIGGAPSTLNDLNELAAAINDDANYNTTLTTALGTKMPIAGGTFTGAINVTGSVTADGLTVGSTSEAAGLFTGYSSITGVNSVNNGEIRLGSNNGYNGRISYDGQTGGVLYIENSYNSDAADIVFRSKTAGTAQNKLKLDGNGDISFYEDTGTTPKFFWDASAESLGIGTTVTNFALDVQNNQGTNATWGRNIANLVDGETNDTGLRIASSVGTDGLTQLVAATNSSASQFGFMTYNGSAWGERMRIDSSGNLLVGKTSANYAVEGVEIRPNEILITKAGANPLSVRNNGAGGLISLNSAGTSVGSIGTVSSSLYIASPSGSQTGLRFSNNVVHACNSSGAPRDNAIDLGYAQGRFKDGYFSGTVNAANFNTTSDATLKTNVETLTGSLDAVKSLRGVSYDWIESGGSEVGVIAQEVEAVLPDVVSTNDEGIKSVKYGNMVAVLIEAIKEQQVQIDELKAQLNS